MLLDHTYNSKRPTFLPVSLEKKGHGSVMVTCLSLRTTDALLHKCLTNDLQSKCPIQGPDKSDTSSNTEQSRPTSNTEQDNNSEDNDPSVDRDTSMQTEKDPSRMYLFHHYLSLYSAAVSIQFSKE